MSNQYFKYEVIVSLRYRALTIVHELQTKPPFALTLSIA
jgi:hypothetical protein